MTSSSPPTDLNQRAAILEQELTSFHAMHFGRHRRNFASHYALVVLVILCSIAIPILSLVQEVDRRAIAVVGILSGGLLAIHSAVGFGVKAQFQRVVASEAENLLTDIRTRVPNTELLDRTTRRLQALRLHADRKLPLGNGMDAAAKLATDLAKAQ